MDGQMVLMCGVLIVALGGGFWQHRSSMRILAFADRLLDANDRTLERALAINEYELALSRSRLELDQAEMMLREKREIAKREGLSYAPQPLPKRADMPDVSGNVGTNMPGIEV